MGSALSVWNLAEIPKSWRCQWHQWHSLLECMVEVGYSSGHLGGRSLTKMYHLKKAKMAKDVREKMNQNIFSFRKDLRRYGPLLHFWRLKIGICKLFLLFGCIIKLGIFVWNQPTRGLCQQPSSSSSSSWSSCKVTCFIWWLLKREGWECHEAATHSIQLQIF